MCSLFHCKFLQFLSQCSCSNRAGVSREILICEQGFILQAHLQQGLVVLLGRWVVFVKRAQVTLFYFILLSLIHI